MKVSVLLFAAAREIAGTDSLVVETHSPAPTIRDLRTRTIELVPRLAGIAASLLWAVNNEYASDDRQIAEHDLVACFPPVSGG